MQRCSLFDLRPRTSWRSHRMLRSFISVQSLTLSACGAKASIKVHVTSGAAKIAPSALSPSFEDGRTASRPGFEVTAISRMVVSPQEKVALAGKNFRPTMTIASTAFASTPVKVLSDVKASFTLPEGTPYGLFDVTFIQDGATQKITLFSNGGKTDFPVITAAPDQICRGIQFYDATGTLAKGSKKCSPVQTNPDLPNCHQDGQINCRAVEAFRATDMSKATPGSIQSGVTLAGIQGTYPSAATPLRGDTNRADLTTVGPTTEAGVFEFFDSRGNTHTVSITDSPPITPSTVEQSFGGTGTLYRAIVVSAVSPPPPPPPSQPACTANGEVNCVTTDSFKAADLSSLSPGNIKSGVLIAGTRGTYPSAATPLAANTPATDLTAVNPTTATGTYDFFDSKGNVYSVTIADGGAITPTHATQSFGASGTLYRAFEVVGEARLVPENIKNGQTIWGVTGRYGPTCSADGSVDCVVSGSSTLRAANVSGISGWDLRAGKTIGGISGDLVFYRNMVNTNLFDRISGSGSLPGVDIYDTIDDFNNNNLAGSIIPTTNPWLPPIMVPGPNWQRDKLSDDNANSLCESNEACVEKDLTTDLLWAKDDGNTTRSWDQAITFCAELNYGGYQGGWRLPTHKEMMQAYINGIWANKTPLNLTKGYYWSATTISDNTSLTRIVDIGDGFTDAYNKSWNGNHILCVK